MRASVVSRQLKLWIIGQLQTLGNIRKIEYFCGITMDIAAIAHGISKDLQYYNCVKKFIENWNYSRGFNRNFIPTNRYKNYYIS